MVSRVSGHLNSLGSAVDEAPSVSSWYRGEVFVSMAPEGLMVFDLRVLDEENKNMREPWRW
jgi:hypothetical protein